MDLAAQPQASAEQKMRVLFVDDEQNVLDGLRRTLRRQRREWDMEFVTSGEAAIAKLSQGLADVIVSDMRMPGMDGATLLTRVQEEFPSVIRIVLSGYAEMEMALKAMPVAHQFLNKPCDADLLREVVRRAFGLKALLERSSLRETVGRVKGLPSLPKVHARLLALLSDPETSAKDAAKVVSEDPAISAKLLQLVNSAFFGLPRSVTSVEEAIVQLGLVLTKNIVLSVEVLGAFNAAAKKFDPGDYQTHGVLAGRVAQRLVKNKSHGDEAFVAGLLHDVGKLVFASHFPETYDKVLTTVKASGRDQHEVEIEELGVGHAEVGGYLLGLWGLPYPVVEAVANHHNPGRIGATDFGTIGAVHVANGLSREPDPKTALATGRLDEEFLTAIGVIDQLDDFRKVVERLARTD